MVTVQCPQCESMNLKLSPRLSWQEKLLAWFGWRYLVCLECNNRFRSSHPPNY